MKPEYNLTIEEYIEIIHELQKENEGVRVKDIAEKRGVTRSTVSTALSLLKKKKLIIHENYGQVALTQKGMKLGNKLEVRHQAIKNFLNQVLGLDLATAEADACQLEHYMSPVAVKQLVNFTQFIKECHYSNPQWFEWFKKCGIFGNGNICPFCEIEKADSDNI